MRKYVRLSALAVLAGAAIGIGGIVFLSLENKIVGALMFTAVSYTHLERLMPRRILMKLLCQTVYMSSRNI